MDLKTLLANSSQSHSLRFFIGGDDDEDDDDKDEEEVEEEDGPEDTSSKLLSIPFTEVFCDDDAMLRREKGVKQTKTDEIRLRLLAFLK